MELRWELGHFTVQASYILNDRFFSICLFQHKKNTFYLVFISEDELDSLFSLRNTF